MENRCGDYRPRSLRLWRSRFCSAILIQVPKTWATRIQGSGNRPQESDNAHERCANVNTGLDSLIHPLFIFAKTTVSDNNDIGSCEPCGLVVVAAFGWPVF